MMYSWNRFLNLPAFELLHPYMYIWMMCENGRKVIHRASAFNNCGKSDESNWNNMAFDVKTTNQLLVLCIVKLSMIDSEWCLLEKVKLMWSCFNFCPLANTANDWAISTSNNNNNCKSKMHFRLQYCALKVKPDWVTLRCECRHNVW